MINIDTNFGPITFKSLDFSGGEVQVRIDAFAYPLDVTSTIKITAYLYNPRDIMELIMVMDALRRMVDSRIDLVVPYLPYARQDRVCAPGESFALHVFLETLLIQMTWDSLEVWDVHSPVAIKEYPLMKNRPAFEFVEKIKFDQMPIIVAPDKGAVDRASLCAAQIGTNYILAGKTRDPNDGKITGSIVEDFRGLDISTSDLLMVDDICDGGRTFIELAKVLRPLTTGKIMLYVTHGIFSQGLDPMKHDIDHIYSPHIFPGVARKTSFFPDLSRFLTQIEA